MSDVAADSELVTRILVDHACFPSAIAALARLAALASEAGRLRQELDELNHVCTFPWSEVANLHEILALRNPKKEGSA